MSSSCAVHGCANAPSRLGRYCAAHQTRRTRYGHPLQRSVSSRDLEPFVCRAVSRLEVAEDLASIIDARWSFTLAHVSAVASGIVRDTLAGPSGDRKATPQERTAARLFLATARGLPARQVAEMVAALVVMRTTAPETFEDDTAFAFVVARRFLGFSPANAMKDARSKSTTYRSFPPTTMEPIAGWLLDAFGEIGEALGRMEVEEVDHRATEAARLADTLAGLR